MACVRLLGEYQGLRKEKKVIPGEDGKYTYLSELPEEDYRRYKNETLRRLSAIAEAEGHALVAYVMADGFATLVDLETGKESHSKA